MSRYQFKPYNLPVLNRDIIEEILKQAKMGRSELRVSLDLGISKVKVEIHGDRILLPGGIHVDLSELESARDSRAIYICFPNGKLRKAEIRTRLHYYKLINLGLRAPTLEIDGIHMHRIVEVTPWLDSRLKVKFLRVKPGMRVLDVCTGLGYTAIWEKNMGASKIITVEKDENVLELAKYNPWSRELDDPRIEIYLNDAVEFIKDIPSEYFHRILHDPPRLTKSTGELYSLNFYKELYRVLKLGGILVHYTGQPGAKHRGLNIPGRIASRLKQAGFINVRYIDKIKGIIALKL